MRNILSLLLGLTTALVADIAQPQGVRAADDFSAGRKITGSVYRPYTARTYQRHAINHAQVLSQYGRHNETVPTETAQEHAAETKRNLTAAQSEIAKLKTELKNDPEAMKLIAQIEEHNKKASECCGMLDAECAKQAPQGATVAHCCADVLKELRAAEEAHEQLLKHLKVPVHADKSEK